MRELRRSLAGCWSSLVTEFPRCSYAFPNVFQSVVSLDGVLFELMVQRNM
jgi:hypothetical protein